MVSLRGRNISLLGVFIFIFQASSLFAKESSAWESSEWSSWLNRFASSSPILASRKNKPSHLQVSDQHIKQVTGGKTKLSFSPPLHIDSRPIASYDLIGFDVARQFQVTPIKELEAFKKETAKVSSELTKDRSRKIRSNIEKLISEREQNSLLLIVVDRIHALDLFFTTFTRPDLLPQNPLNRVAQETLYVDYEYDDQTEFYTPQFYEFVTRMRGSPFEPILLGTNSLILYGGLLARLYYYVSLKSDLLDLKKVTQEAKPEPGVIVVMDIPNIRSASVFSEMPTAYALKTKGFSKLKVYMEGWTFGEKYTEEDLKGRFRADAASFFSKQDLEYYRKFRKSAFSMLQSGFDISYSLKQLHLKLNEYRSQGIEVSLEGVDI